MRKIMYMAVAAIAALSSCSSDEFAVNNNNNGDAKVFTATIENDGTRSTYDGTNKNALWETTDIVSINGVKYQAQSGGAATTTFAKASEETAAAPTAPYYAFFADGANTGTGSYSATGKFTLPVSYNYAAGKFNMPMYAESSTTSLSFKNICGVLAITVPANTTSVVVKSENQMNGAFTATAEGVLTFTPTTITKDLQTITVTYPKNESSTQKVYVPVPAGNYDALVIECNSQSMTVKKTVTVERNKIYSITFSSNSVTTRGLAEATVSAGSSNTKYVAWVQLWSGGPKFAAFNVGATITDYASANSKSSTASEKYKSPDYVGGYYYWGSDNTSSYSSSTTDIQGTNDDTATKLWGSAWQMPKKSDFDDLINTSKCTWTWCSGETGSQYVEGCTLAGYKIEGLGEYASSSVFFPAAGYYYSNYIDEQGKDGYCWSSAPNTSYNAHELFFNSYNRYVGNYSRYYGYSVRAVLK